MFNKDTKSTYAGAMKVLVALLAFSVVSIAAMRLYSPASSEGTTESASSDNTFKSSTLTDVSNAAMAPLACTNTSQYGSATAPTAPCVEVNFTTCQYEGEYAVMSGAVAGTTYTFSAGVATTYITVRSGTYNGAVVAEGVQPLDATPTVSGTLYVHFNTNASCGTGSSCMVTSVACKSCTPPPATYCAVTSTGNTSYGIKNVTTTGGVGNINNTTGSGNYTDYTTQFVSALEGTPVDFSVSPVINSTFGYAIWVDWNNNKCFEASEKKASAGYISGNFTGTLNIPAGTAPGDYRMRVVNNYLSGAPTACGNLGSNGYGEAEDYTFRVLGATGGPVPCNIDYKYSLVNGYGNTQTLLFADDFEVGANTDMTVEKVTFRLYNDIAMATDIRFYTDNAGTPGTVVKAYTNVAPSAKNFLGTNFGLNFYDMVFTLPTTTTLSTGKYWVAIKTAGGSGVNYWVTTDVGINNPGKYTSNNGVTWIQNSGAANLSFKLDGKCLDTSAGGGIECLLVCSNNQTITLAPGTCEANVNYLVTTVGPKCTQSKQGPVTKTSQITTTPANVDDGLRCGAAGLTGWHSRAYPAFSEDYTMTGIDVMAWNGGQQKIKVFAYTGAMGGQFLDKTKMTQLYESPFFNVADFQITHYDFPTPVVIPANTNFVIEQSSPAGSYLWHIASTYTNQTAKSYIACSATANPEDYGVWMGGYSYIHLYQVLYGSLSTPGITIEQTKGLPSGSIFPVGTTTNCFRLINADGDAIDSCCFDITINKYPNPSKTLVCNDFLYISADDKCQVNLNADMFLEGGPYACYSDYIIKVDGAVIQQNVPLNIPLGVHQYEITDPATGNRCWGNFKVEDKLAPTLACSCEDKDILEPVTSYAGQIKETDPLFDRCNFVSPYNPMYYTTQKFQVSTNGTYSFQLTTNWTTAYYIYESDLFDPTNPCNNVLASLEVTFIPIPPMNATLQAGKTYVLVATTMWNYDLYAGLYPLDFSFAFSGPGDVLFVTNASDAPECQFKCYDLETVQAETV
ncbi:MAG TPA: GEVED domain-containing protein, partial [Saprospiraceae bacterium]|nr:GEVED domain-containing protein [Saprospiraceae bacterium]HRP42056.1 GEVED domain-containing protein [Saprospiraceae bacterium]